MVLAILGHGFLIASTPVTPLPWSSLPVVASSTTGSMPKKGKVAEPGLVGTAPGRGVSKWAPDSVCQ